MVYTIMTAGKRILSQTKELGKRLRIIEAFKIRQNLLDCIDFLDNEMDLLKEEISFVKSNKGFLKRYEHDKIR